MSRTPTQTLARPQPDTLPRVGHAPAGRTRTALLALLGSALLLVGVPVGLVLGVGNPLPTSAPSSAWLTADVTAGVVLDVLAVLLWLVWAHFLVCFLAEWRALRAGRMPARVALGAGSQTLARQLVAGILLLSGGASIAHGATALAADPPADAGTSRPSAAQDAEPGAGTPGAGAEEPRVTLEAEPQAVKHYEVRPPEGRHHDTLWDIAERLLGDPFRYKEIYALNQNRLQPDGRRLTDADLIHPGWQLRLPADAAGPGVRLTPVRSTPALPVPTPGNAAGSAAEAAGSADAGMADVVDRAVRPGAADRAGASDATPEAAATAEPAVEEALGSLVLGGGLVLAGIAGALAARRGPFGEPDPDTAALAAAADRRRAAFVDQALRSLAQARAAADRPMPEVMFAYVDEDQVVLHLARADHEPERPWTAAEDGYAWTLRADDLMAPSPGVAAPYPCLVPVADSHGFELLVDLEMAPGLVSLGGDAVTAREVAMSMAVDLATHAWSDRVGVVMVGFGDELADLADSGIGHVAHLDDAVAEVERQHGKVAKVMAELGVSGVLEGRQLGPSRDHAPTVLVVSGPPTAEQAKRLARITGGGRTPVCVVCVGDTPSARWRFVVDRAGHLDAGVLGVAGTARRLTRDGEARLEEMLAQALRRRERGEAELATVPPARIAEDLVVLDPEPDPGGVSLTAGDLSSAAVQVRLLGPVAVHAPGHVDAVRRDLLTEVVVMAALHPDGLHEAVLRASLWPRGVEQDVVDARLADAQEWLGSDAAGRPRLRAAEDGRWQLADDVAVDLAVLASAARRTGPGELDALLGALRLGTGEAFAAPAGQYSWLVFAREARQGRLLATSVARRAAEVATALDRPAQAEEALTLGLRLVPTAEVLWRDRLRLVAQHDPARLGRAVTQMYSVLDEHGVRHEPETDALVQELAPDRVGAAGG